MAIPTTPSNPYLQTANSQNLLSWDAVVSTPTLISYSVQRSLDGVTYTSVSSPTTLSYLDTTVTIGTQYWYQVAAVNADGTSLYTIPKSIVPAPIGEMSLVGLRYSAMQKADRVNSKFVTKPEWDKFINLALTELYDLLITVYQDYFEAPEVSFIADGTTYEYPLPDGFITFTDSQSGQTIVAPPFLKLTGVDLAVNNANNAYVTLDKYNLIDRNNYVYPNSAGTIYGVFNLQYRLMGNKIRFIPTPTANQIIRLLYIPRLRELLQDTDLTTIGYSGWLDYVICRAAKYALDKEESDTSAITAELLFLMDRINASAINRDAGRPDTISDVRTKGGWSGMNGQFHGGY